MSANKKIRKLFEEERDRLCGEIVGVADSYLYINFKKNIAVIGIKTKMSRFSRMCFILIAQKKYSYSDVETKLVLEKEFSSGEMFPTGISRDGTKFFYKVRNDVDSFHKKEKKI